MVCHDLDLKVALALSYTIKINAVILYGDSYAKVLLFFEITLFIL